MATVYVEPRPKARPAGAPIEYYVLITAHDAPLNSIKYPTQAAAVADAQKLGHHPDVSRVRHTDKGHPDQFRKA